MRGPVAVKGTEVITLAEVQVCTVRSHESGKVRR
jgi:hypothetical protein